MRKIKKRLAVKEEPRCIVENDNRVMGDVKELVSGICTVEGPDKDDLAMQLGPAMPMRQVRTKKLRSRKTKSSCDVLDIDDLIRTCEAEGVEINKKNNTETLTIHGKHDESTEDEICSPPRQETGDTESKESDFSSDGSETDSKGGKDDDPSVEAKKKAGFESSDEGSSSDEDVEMAVPEIVSICGLPADRYHLPPDPSRQPHMVLVAMEKQDILRLGGFNVRCKVLKGMVEVCNGLATEKEWFMVWGGEVTYAVSVTPAVSTPSKNQELWSGDHVLLTAKPTEDDYRWAISTAAKISSQKPGTTCVLLTAANRSPTLEYHHSYHPTPTPQLLGNIMNRLHHCSDVELMKMPKGNGMDGVLSGNSKRVVIVGQSNSGKSTLSRFTANSLGKCVYLDTDLGQPEFSPPGCVSLTVVTSLLVGPAYTHRAVDGHRMFLGMTTTQTNPFAWFDAVKQMLKIYEKNYPDLPLIVNTHGWCTGLGLRCTAEVLQAVLPDTVVVTGGLGNVHGGDKGEDDTQESRVLALFEPERGFLQVYSEYFGKGVTEGNAERKTPGVVVCDQSELPNRTHSKGSWSRQVLQTMAVVGAKLNYWDGFGVEEGHGVVRTFLNASHPVEVNLSKMWLFEYGAEWSEHIPDTCTPSSLLVKLKHKIICLAVSPSLPSPQDGLNILRIAPTSSYIGLAYVAATSPTHLYIITSIPPTQLHIANLIIGSIDAPSGWRRAPSSMSATKPVGKGVLQDRQGGPGEKRRRVG
eukprot:TRINITY_DN16429_c0_g1_i1.p1 TRINITY_DN16429_c0_g1~~TRINITY_DN16429_c0_g1_i1.p1  ORF type:complete len:750 (+),score=77.24 TRINITY_DN16429_c0_g1_i1:108-2357(+)